MPLAASYLSSQLRSPDPPLTAPGTANGEAGTAVKEEEVEEEEGGEKVEIDASGVGLRMTREGLDQVFTAGGALSLSLSLSFSDSEFFEVMFKLEVDVCIIEFCDSCDGREYEEEEEEDEEEAEAEVELGALGIGVGGR